MNSFSKLKSPSLLTFAGVIVSMQSLNIAYKIYKIDLTLF